jgi:hypothetical protein
MFNRIKKLLAPGDAPYQTVVWEREERVRQALAPFFPKAPCCVGGRYSWLASPQTGAYLQLDIFYFRIDTIMTAPKGTPVPIQLPAPTTLAVEVQSSLHDGKWTRDKRAFFPTKSEFEQYTRNQAWKRARIQALHIPFLEIDPSKDDLSYTAMRARLATLFNVTL